MIDLYRNAALWGTRSINGVLWIPKSVLSLIYDYLDLWKDKEKREADHGKVRNFLAFLTVLGIAIAYCYKDIQSNQSLDGTTLALLISLLGYSLGERVFLALFHAWQSVRRNPVSTITIEDASKNDITVNNPVAPDMGSELRN